MCIAFANIKLMFGISRYGLIAIHNSAKVWVAYSEYTISESHLESGILHLRYENDIPIISRHSGIVVRWHLQF